MLAIKTKEGDGKVSIEMRARSFRESFLHN